MCAGKISSTTLAFYMTACLGNGETVDNGLPRRWIAGCTHTIPRMSCQNHTLPVHRHSLAPSSNDNLLGLLDDLLDVLLERLGRLVGLGFRLESLLMLAEPLLLLLECLLGPLSPCVPFVDQAATLRLELARDVHLLELVDLVKLSAVLAQVLYDLLLLRWWQEGSRPRAPEELLELVNRRILGDLGAPEVVDSESRLELCMPIKANQSCQSMSVDEFSVSSSSCSLPLSLPRASSTRERHSKERKFIVK